MYTKNRTFRIVGSTKFGRTAALVPVALDGDWARQTLAWFRNTLVCAVGELSAGLQILSMRANETATSSGPRAPWQPPRAPADVHAHSLYPAIDAFIVSVAAQASSSGTAAVASPPLSQVFVRGVVFFPEGTHPYPSPARP